MYRQQVYGGCPKNRPSAPEGLQAGLSVVDAPAQGGASCDASGGRPDASAGASMAGAQMRARGGALNAPAGDAGCGARGAPAEAPHALQAWRGRSHARRRRVPCHAAGRPCQWLPLAKPSAGAWTAPPRRRHRLPCTGLPCREPCLPAPAVRPWCSGRCTGRTSACTSRRTSCAGAPAVARRGAGSVWNALHGTARPARPDIGSRHPQASRSRPGRATGHPRGQASSATPTPCLPVSESKPFPPSKAASRPKEASSGLALYWPRVALSAKEGLLIQHQTAGLILPCSSRHLAHGDAEGQPLPSPAGLRHLCFAEPVVPEFGPGTPRLAWCQKQPAPALRRGWAAA